MLERILRARDTEEFCSVFFEEAGMGEASLGVVFREACSHASGVYPDIYSAPHYFVPHAYMGLAAAWQAKDYLKETDRWRPLLQALWYLATETRKWGAHTVGVVEGTMVRGGELESSLSEALRGGDFDALFSLYAGCQRSPALARLATRAVLSAALRDSTNIGHKFIYVVKALQLMRQTAVHDPSLLRAPLHFLSVAPPDMELSKRASAWLESEAERLYGCLGNIRGVDYDRAMQLRDSILGNQGEVLEVMTDLLESGYSLQSVADSLLLAASHLVYYVAHDDPATWWISPVHGFSFTQSVGYGLKWLSPREKVLALFINALYLREMAKSSGTVKVDDSIGAGPEDGNASLQRLEEAVERSDAAGAVDQMKGLLANRTSFPELAERLVLLASSRERFTFTHVAKHLYFLLRTSRRTDSRRWQEHAIAFVKFLALTPKGREVVQAAHANPISRRLRRLPGR